MRMLLLVFGVMSTFGCSRPIECDDIIKPGDEIRLKSDKVRLVVSKTEIGRYGDQNDIELTVHIEDGILGDRGTLFIDQNKVEKVSK